MRHLVAKQQSTIVCIGENEIEAPDQQMLINHVGAKQIELYETSSERLTTEARMFSSLHSLTVRRRKKRI